MYIQFDCDYIQEKMKELYTTIDKVSWNKMLLWEYTSLSWDSKSSNNT